jgi:indole-3-glycerol phosphate synthase
MTILNEIITHKRKEVAENEELRPVKLLKKSIFFNSTSVSLKEYIKREDKSGIIAEFKRRSPSKGMINEFADIEQISIGYMQAGASALSVLTDSKYFGGKSNDLINARKFNYCPILRKDFIISEYQIIESKFIGADAILLIASVLTAKEIIQFTRFAHKLGLEVLLEIHSEEELEKYFTEIDLVGINNRNLKTFEVNFDNASKLVSKLPDDTIKIAESGIKSPEDIFELRNHGFDGFLIGESFMRFDLPERECKKFINKLKELNHVNV